MMERENERETERVGNTKTGGERESEVDRKPKDREREMIERTPWEPLGSAALMAGESDAFASSSIALKSSSSCLAVFFLPFFPISKMGVFCDSGVKRGARS